MYIYIYLYIYIYIYVYAHTDAILYDTMHIITILWKCVMCLLVFVVCLFPPKARTKSQ